MMIPELEVVKYFKEILFQQLRVPKLLLDSLTKWVPLNLFAHNKCLLRYVYPNMSKKPYNHSPAEFLLESFQPGIDR